MLETFLAHRPRLFGLAYRMTGSAAEAEDLLQETWLRWQAADPAEIRSPAAYLTTMVTRLGLDHLKSARVQREQYPGIWLPEPISSELADDPVAAVERFDSLSIALLYLLERLSPEERAVFLLREVFAYDYDAIAAIVNKSPANCRQLVSRAKKQIAAHRPLNATPRAEHQRVLHSFLQAVQTGDLHNLMQLMAADVVSYADGGGKAPAAIHPVHGAERVGKLIVGLQRKAGPGTTITVARLNGREGFLIRDAQGAILTAVLLDIAAGLVRGLYAVVNPEKLRAVQA